ncbi:MAG: hypothetical protein ACREJ2_16210 [Planctomycetota bacterium]
MLIARQRRNRESDTAAGAGIGAFRPVFRREKERSIRVRAVRESQAIHSVLK